MSLSSLTILDAHEGLRQKKFSSTELVRDILRRIKKIDPKVKAYLTLDEEGSLQKAEEADKQIAKNNFKQVLLGIPFSLKDNICTKGLRTTAASKVLDKYIPVYDATVAGCLKEAGAIIIAKTNMDAWAHGSSTETSDFFTTRNPWDTSRLPGGSSGGSAASVISDMTIGSIGTETAGSIRQPAAWCGITGLKPTYGRVSRYGIISMGSSLDSPGPMAKTVEDAALVLNVIAGQDFFDATSSPKRTIDYTKNLKTGVKGLKIGIPDDYFVCADKNVAKTVEEAVLIFKKLGASIKKVKLLDPQYAISVYTILQRAEVSANLARYDGIRYGNDRSYFGQEAKRRIMLGTYSLSAGYYDDLYVKAQKVRTLIIEDFNRVFNMVDIVLSPTSPYTALPVGVTQGDPMFGEMQDVLVEPSAIAGICGINLPCGFIDGLPVGMQILAPQFQEELLLQTGYAYQQATDWHKRRPNLE